GRKADDGLATRGTRRTTDETSLRGHSAIELAFELIDADLACQIDGEGLRNRNHARLAGDLLGIANLFYGQELKARVFVDEIGKPARFTAGTGEDTNADTGF